MIRHHDTPVTTVVSDARGCLTLFGGLFVLSGLTALALAGTAPGLGGVLATALIGTAHVTGGLWLAIGRARRATVHADGVRVEARRWGRWRVECDVAAADIAAVGVVGSLDSDGDPAFAPELRLRSGATAALTDQTLSLPEPVVEIVRAVARRLGRPEAVDG